MRFFKYIFVIFSFITTIETFAQNTIIKSFNYDGRLREYAIYEPANYTNTKALPLILVLHHNGATGPGVMDYMGYKSIADTAGFLSIYPTALEDQFASPHAWNAGLNPLNQIDDVGFLSALIDTMIDNYLIDTNRVYATGHSMGGYMSHRLGCELSNRIAAIAPSAGTLASWIISDCNPPRAVPVMHKHGTNDNTVKWDGTEPPFSTSVDTTIKFWVEHNGCTGLPIITQLPDIINDGYYYETIHYKQCKGESEVILYKAVGAPHGWQAVGHDISPPLEVWKFFLRHILHKLDSNITSVPVSPSEKLELQIYPNPFKEILYFEKSTNDPIRIEIYDISGKLVKQLILNSDLIIETSQWESGIYFLKYVYNNQVRQLKLVKN